MHGLLVGVLVGRFCGSLHVGYRRNAWLQQQLPYVEFELNQH
jgi:hypothetical protein